MPRTAQTDKEKARANWADNFLIFCLEYVRDNASDKHPYVSNETEVAKKMTHAAEIRGVCNHLANATRKRIANRTNGKPDKEMDIISSVMGG